VEKQHNAKCTICHKKVMQFIAALGIRKSLNF
jgi:hypothetical protein